MPCCSRPPSSSCCASSERLAPCTAYGSPRESRTVPSDAAPPAAASAHGTAQSLPCQPSKHAHAPEGRQAPCIEQRPGQPRTPQSLPSQPAGQKQPPSTHMPRPEQSFSQAWLAQSSPPQPASHSHSCSGGADGSVMLGGTSRQAPCPVQTPLPGHSLVAHA